MRSNLTSPSNLEKQRKHHRIATLLAGDPARLLLIQYFGRGLLVDDSHLALLLGDDTSQLLPLGQLLAQDVGRILVPCLDGLPHRLQQSKVYHPTPTTARKQQIADMVPKGTSQRKAGSQGTACLRGRIGRVAGKVDTLAPSLNFLSCLPLSTHSYSPNFNSNAKFHCRA